MLINIQLGQCTDINLEFTLFGKRITQFVIESVNSLDHQDIFLSKLQFIPFLVVSLVSTPLVYAATAWSVRLLMKLFHAKEASHD